MTLYLYFFHSFVPQCIVIFANGVTLSKNTTFYTLSYLCTAVVVTIVNGNVVTTITLFMSCVYALQYIKKTGSSFDYRRWFPATAFCDQYSLLTDNDAFVLSTLQRSLIINRVDRHVFVFTYIHTYIPLIDESTTLYNISYSGLLHLKCNQVFLTDEQFIFPCVSP